MKRPYEYEVDVAIEEKERVLLKIELPEPGTQSKTQLNISGKGVFKIDNEGILDVGIGHELLGKKAIITANLSNFEYDLALFIYKLYVNDTILVDHRSDKSESKLPEVKIIIYFIPKTIDDTDIKIDKKVKKRRKPTGEGKQQPPPKIDQKGKVPPPPQTKKNKLSESVPVYTDNPELSDRLGRLPIAKSIVAVVNNIWDSQNQSKDHRQSFMIHVQGPWGSGKSTFLNLVEKELKKKDWIVVKYNAWQHQHMDNPWWSLLNCVYKDSIKQTSLLSRLPFIIKEKMRRFFSGKLLYNFLTIILFIVTIILAFVFIPKLISGDSAAQNNNVTPIAELIVLLGSALFTIISFVKSVSNSLLPGSSESANSFLKQGRDPLNRVKRHFNSLIHSAKKPIAIFIDDIDRCEPDLAVRLLEGIQTLFRDEKVLYIVAADRNWIAKCFEIHYEKFADTSVNQGSRLGYLFIQKAFQLSVRLPLLSQNKIKSYWNLLLENGLKPDDEFEKKAKELAIKYKDAETEEQVRNITNDLIANENIPESIAKSAAIDKLNEQEFLEATEHELSEYGEYLEPNPRAIKRLANFYNVFNRTLFLEDRHLDTSVKVRWLILSQRWPVLADILEKHPGIIEDGNKAEEMEVNNILLLPEVKKLISGTTKYKKLTEQDIKDCIGWED